MVPRARAHLFHTVWLSTCKACEPFSWVLRDSSERSRPIGHLVRSVCTGPRLKPFEFKIQKLVCVMRSLERVDTSLIEVPYVCIHPFRCYVAPFSALPPASVSAITMRHSRFSPQELLWLISNHPALNALSLISPSMEDSGWLAAQFKFPDPIDTTTHLTKFSISGYCPEVCTYVLPLLAFNT